MRRLFFLFIAGFVMAGTVKITFPTSENTLIIGRGPYEIRWKFSGFEKPWLINLDILLDNNCKIASGVALTHTAFFWIPDREICPELTPGKHSILLKWKGGEAKSGEFRIGLPPVNLFIALEPDRKNFNVGGTLKLSWSGIKKKGSLSLWMKGEKFCTIENRLDLEKGFYLWKIPGQCNDKSLIGKFVQFRLMVDGRELAESHVFKITGEMPRPGRRW